MKLGIFSCNFLVFVVFFGICRVQLDVDGEINDLLNGHLPVHSLCPGQWNNYSGYCYQYFKREVALQKAQAATFCKNHSRSNLVDIQSAGENDFTVKLVRERMKGQETYQSVWLGLQNINGVVQWDNGMPLNYYDKAPWQDTKRPGWRGRDNCAIVKIYLDSNDWSIQHCEETSNGVVCKTDADECSSGLHSCDSNATCTNTEGSYTCKCTLGFTGNGTKDDCHDLDECSFGQHSCDSNANCTNTYSSYTCKCMPGYSGNGTKGGCPDVDECSSGLHSCDNNAECTNTEPSYTCQCKPGYSGNGTKGGCPDFDECSSGGHNCDNASNFVCKNNIGSFTCVCKSGFTFRNTSNSCEETQCDASFNNTYLIMNPNISIAKFNTTVFFSCEKGFKLIGTPSSTCKDEEWTDPFPECQIDNSTTAMTTSAIHNSITNHESTSKDSSWLKDDGLIIAVALAAVLLNSVVVICYREYCKRKQNKKPPVCLYSSDNGGRGNRGTTLTRPYQNVLLSERVQNCYELAPVAARCTEVQAET